MASWNTGKGKASGQVKYLPQNDPPDPTKAPKRNFKRKDRKEVEESNAKAARDPKNNVPLPNCNSGFATDDRVELETNCFSVNTSAIARLYLYSVSFCPGYEPGSRRRERRVLQIMMDDHRALYNAATDYRQQIVSTALITQNQSSTSIPVRYYEDGDPAPQVGDADVVTCWVQVDYSKSLSMGDFHHYLANPRNNTHYQSKDEIVTALNLLFARHPNQASLIQELSNNKIFDTGTPPAHRTPIGGGLDAYLGFEKSSRTSTRGALLNVNALTSEFYLEVLVSVLIDKWSRYWSESPAPERKWQYAHENVHVLERFLKGVRVRATYEPRRFYSIWAIPRIKTGRPLPAQVEFELEERDSDNTVKSSYRTTVWEYYKDREYPAFRPCTGPANQSRIQRVSCPKQCDCCGCRLKPTSHLHPFKSAGGSSRESLLPPISR
jgi:N-terminal domain of argonaute/Argonaute linker 1 domain